MIFSQRSSEVKPSLMTWVDESSADSTASVVERAVLVIDAVHEAGGQVSLTGLVAATGLPKTTVHRLANELLRLGVLERRDTVYRLGVRAFQWGNCAPFISLLRNVALPVMEELARLGRLVVRVSVLDGDDAVFLATLGNHWLPEEGGARHALREPRTRIPAHATASGKVMLAYANDPLPRRLPLTALTNATITDPGRLRRQLSDVRTKGYGIDVGESRNGVVAVAAPLWSSSQVVGALSIASPNGALEPDFLAPIVERGALQLRSLLTHRPAV